MKTLFTEILYTLIGLIIIMVSFHIAKDKTKPNRWTTSLFWLIVGFIFIFAKFGVYLKNDFTLNTTFVGYLLLIFGVLTTFKLVDSSTKEKATAKEKMDSANKLGNKIFIPAASIALGTVFFSFLPLTKPLGSLVALGLASVVALILALVFVKAPVQDSLEEGGRLLQLMGPMSILPQLLAALGAVFTVAGVGEVIANYTGRIIPENNHFIGVLFYCLGMLVFTIIMGNGFAAFAVITAGIGLPFLIEQGANPVVVGALGLTAGYCGTLLTPMAANFNIVPTAILEIKDKQFGVIKKQALVASVLWILHVFVMYQLAF